MVKALEKARDLGPVLAAVWVHSSGWAMGQATAKAWGEGTAMV